jgi:nicotinamidase-related amidase
MDERNKNSATNEPTRSQGYSRSGDRSSSERPQVRSKSDRALVIVDLVPSLVAGPVPPAGVADVLRYVQGELRYFRERDRLVVFSVAQVLAVEDSGPTVKELTPRTHEVVVSRPSPSVFSTPMLHERFQEAGVKRVTLVGIGTAGVIAASAIDALTRGYRVTVPDPCVCDFVVEDHRAALHLIRDVWTPLFRPGDEGEEITAPGLAYPHQP